MDNTAEMSPALASSVMQDSEKKKKTFLEILKELLEILRKPGYYGAMKEIENNLNELSYTNALTNEVLDSLISTVGEVKGNLNDMSAEKAESIIEDIQTKMDGLKNRVANFEDIRSLSDAETYELYERGGILYLSQPDADGSIGNIAYRVGLSREAETITVSVDKSSPVEIQALESDEYELVPLPESDSRIDCIIHAVAVCTLSKDEQDKYFANEKVIENLNDRAREIYNVVDNQDKLQKSLTTVEGKYTTFVNDENQFCIADTEQSMMMVFNLKEGKLFAECYEINENLKPKDNHSLISAAWRNSGDKINYSRTLNNAYDTAGMFRVDSVRQYLTKVIGLPEDHVRSLGESTVSTPNMNYERLTKGGEKRINKIFRTISNDLKGTSIALDKQISNDGSCIRFKNSRGDVTQLNFNSRGEAINIEYDEIGANKGFVRTHRIIGDMITPEMQAAPFCQHCVSVYASAVNELANHKSEYRTAADARDENKNEYKSLKANKSVER